jgi:hypothetical protein
MEITHAYAGDILKHEKTADGDLVVYGKATGPELDLDQQRCDPSWLKSAMPAWMRWGNVREQHGQVAAGVGVELAAEGEDWMLKTVVVDPGTARKVERGVLKGYSIGIKDAQVVKDATAPGGRIVGGTVVEVSLVDRPANPTATLMVSKAAGGTLAPVDTAGDVLTVTADKGVTLEGLAAAVGELGDSVKSLLADKAGEGEGAKGGGDGTGSAARPEPDKTEIGDLVKAAVAEATKPLEERAKALEAELAKVKQQPIPGGPVISRTATITAPPAETAKTAAYYRDMAGQTQDPIAREGYLKLAAGAGN